MNPRRLIPVKQLRASNFGEVGETFGGSQLKNSHAKSARPFSPRAAIHTVLRVRAPFTLLKRGRRARIEALVGILARRHQIRVHRFANAGNHLHLLIEGRDRKGFTSFLRTLSGSIARFIKLEEERDRAIKSFTTSLWLQRPWTRILARRGRAFRTAWSYVDLNDIEGSYWGVTRGEARRIQEQERILDGS